MRYCLLGTFFLLRVAELLVQGDPASVRKHVLLHDGVIELELLLDRVAALTHYFRRLVLGH